MPKGKQLLKELNGAKNKSKKKGRNQHSNPETADEFLAAGVDQEEGGEKWRAGDAVKAMRFFMRAIELYDTGLSKFPTSFDLAYNKARIQYEITQHPKLATQLPAPQVKILRIALQSHRDALVLDQDNADVLFNTAQVLTSLAEGLTESKRPDEDRLQEAMKYLNEALELFQRCLVLQELRYTESQEQLKMMESGGDLRVSEATSQGATEEMDTQSESEPPENDQWAAVVEPVTKDTLVDTAVAQLEALATLCGLLALSGGNGLAWIEEYSQDLIQTKIAAYVEGTDRAQEVAVARAVFVAALTEVLYRSGRVDVDTYQRELSAAFPPELDLSADPEGLCSKAEALNAFNTAVAENPPSSRGEQDQNSISVRWQALSAALEALTAASKLANADNVAKIHIERGDVEMSRWQLGRPPWNYAAAEQYAATLLKNAQTYYRGAAALARHSNAAEQEKESLCKEAFAAALAGTRDNLDELRSRDSEKVIGIMQEMVEEGLVGLADAESLLM